MQNTTDLEYSVGSYYEEQPIITDSQAKFLSVGQNLYITFAGFSKAM